MATNKKSTIIVQSLFNLVKMIVSWGDYFHQVSLGLDKNCWFFTTGQFLNVCCFFLLRLYILGYYQSIRKKGILWSRLLTFIIVWKEHAGASIIVEVSVLGTSTRKLVRSIIVLTAASTHHFLTVIIQNYRIQKERQ